MKMIKKILFWKLSIQFSLVTTIRNFLYNIGILKSFEFKIPIISVGNLVLGGSGKTPTIEYLIRLLSKKYKIAVLSRGYGRKSRGFILADNSSDDGIVLQSTKELAKIIGTAGTTVKSREMGIVGMFQGFSPEQLEKAERPQIEGEIDDVS